MINLRWEILPGNLTIRKYDDGSNRELELPKYLEGKADYMVALTPYTFEYTYSTTLHSGTCSVCGYETASLAHNFENSKCTVCGCPQRMIMDIIAIPEEDEPLPVPEDQKATL